jgi:hypothetical protein
VDNIGQCGSEIPRKQLLYKERKEHLYIRYVTTKTLCGVSQLDSSVETEKHHNRLQTSAEHTLFFLAQLGRDALK